MTQTVVTKARLRAKTNRMNRLYLILAALAPVFASPLIGGIPADSTQRVVYIEQYLYFLLAFATWNTCLWAATCFLRKNITKLSPRALLHFLPLLLCLLFALSSLQLFRIHFYPSHFYVLIVSMSIQSASVFLIKRKQDLTAIALLSINTLLIGYMTFTFWGLYLNWQALVYLAGLVAQILSLRISLLRNGESPTLLRHRELGEGELEKARIYSLRELRLFRISLLGGFLSIALLVLFGHLPQQYFLIYLLLFLIAPLANTIKLASVDHANLVSKSGQILMAYILLVAMATLYSH